MFRAVRVGIDTKKVRIQRLVHEADKHSDPTRTDTGRGKYIPHKIRDILENE